MKKLLILPLLVLLSACVRYYYPETAYEDGVYYAEDDPAYVVFQGGDPSAAYYPWYSLDYFYLGYNPYPYFSYYYGYPFGFAYGYSPWEYPFTRHGYYSPLYASYYHFPFYPVWRPYYGYCWNYGACGSRPGVYPDDHPGRFAGNRRGRPRGDTGEDVVDEEALAGSLDQLKAAGNGSRMSYNSHVSTMPPGYYGSRGMIVRSNESTKMGKSMIQPADTGSGTDKITIRTSPSLLAVPSASQAAGAPTTVNHARPSYRPVTRPPGYSDMPAPGRSTGVSSRPRPSLSAPSPRPSRTIKSRPPRDLD